MADPFVTYALTDDDQLALHWDAHVRRLLVGYAVVGVIATALAGASGQPAVLGAFVPGMGVITALVASLWFRTRSVVLAELHRRPLHGSTITLTARPDGLDVRGVDASTHPWSQVHAPQISRSSVVIQVGPLTRLLVPRRCFTDPAHETAFLEAIRGGRQQPEVPIRAVDTGEAYVYDLSFAVDRPDLLALNRWFLQAHEPYELWKPVVLGGLAAMAALAVAVVGLRAIALPVVLALLAVRMTRAGRELLVRWRVFRLLRRGQTTGPVRFRARPAGIAYHGQAQLTCSWSIVQRIVEDIDHIYVFNGPATAWIVPRSALGDRAAAFVADARAWTEAAGPYARPPAPKAAPVDAANPFQAPRR